MGEMFVVRMLRDNIVHYSYGSGTLWRNSKSGLILSLYRGEDGARVTLGALVIYHDDPVQTTAQQNSSSFYSASVCPVEFAWPQSGYAMFVRLSARTHADDRLSWLRLSWFCSVLPGEFRDSTLN